MEEEGITANDLERAPDVIRRAKYEVGKTDVLVCGNCHNTFYHIEEFQDHRFKDKCPQDSVLRENERLEPKEQVWAFTLWKNSILNTGKRTEPLTTWTLYKRWCNLTEYDKEAWIIAGQNLQTFTKLSISRLQETRSKTPLSVPKKPGPKPQEKVATQTNETLEEGEIRLSQLTDTQRAAIKAQIAANKTNKENTTAEIKKVPTKLTQLYADLLKKSPEMRRAMRTGDNGKIEEAAFEKVLSRRFNHKNKCLEYLVKWENMKDSENTWEPKSHFDKCKQIIEDFDKIFNTSKITSKSMEQPEIELTGRLPRTSKQKAKDQVKSWCDSMSDDEDFGSSGKRGLFDDDSDSSDSFEKKMKMEEDTDTSEEERRKSKGKLSLNGIAKKSVDNIPQRIVRVSQKHLPNLSTGVYIMSKTEGIIKLNSDTAMPSSSSPLLRVGQKIGQTHIKMVKKDATKSPIKLGQKSKSDPIYSGSSKQNAEDESDGLSDLEFPMDLPLPEPESPPGDFILDPLTGKIAGQEYAEEEETNKDEPELAEDNPEVASLDSLVKMAVSDLPDVEDIVNDSESVIAKMDDVSEPVAAPPLVLPIIKVDPPVVKHPEPPKKLATTSIDLESAITLTAIERIPTGQPVSVTKTPKPKSCDLPVSILNTALTTKVPPKKLLSTTPSTVRQKVAPPRPPIRQPTPTTTTIIHKVQQANRPRAYAQRTIIQPEQLVRRTPAINTYRPASGVTRRIGSTTIYKTSMHPPVPKPQPPQPVAKQQTSFVKPPVVARITSQTPPTPISMPLIGIEEEAIPGTSANTPTSTAELLQTLSSDLPTINLAETDTPLFITGEDGTIYQVAGQNEDGQTILISEGPDGQQQCVIVTTEAAVEEQPLLIASTVIEPQEQQMQRVAAVSPEVTQMEIDDDGDTDGGDDSQVVAQIVKADPPSPGGTRKVVLMLPDGNLMMTDVTAEQYAALDLDK